MKDKLKTLDVSGVKYFLLGYAKQYKAIRLRCKRWINQNFANYGFNKQ